MKKRQQNLTLVAIVVVILILSLIAYFFREEIHLSSPIAGNLLPKRLINIQEAEIFCKMCTSNAQCNPDQICSNKCCRRLTCTDSDGGNNPFTYGLVTIIIEGTTNPPVYSDVCNGTNLTEYYCNGINVESAEIVCTNGCEEGACIQDSPGPVCGNGAIETGEECDDNNLVSGDGCDDKCYSEIATGLTFSRRYGGDGEDYGGISVEELSDGYAVLSVLHESFGDYNYPGWFFKTDKSGQTCSYYLNGNCTSGNLFAQRFSVQGEHMRKTSDNGFIILASDSNPYMEKRQTFLIKKNGSGQTIFQKNWTVMGSSVQQTTDGGYILLGSIIWPLENYNRSTWLTKTDINGNALWTRTFGNSPYEGSHSVSQTSDGGYIVAARVAIIKTNSQGFSCSNNTYTYCNESGKFVKNLGGYYGGGPDSIKETYDKKNGVPTGYIVAGYKNWQNFWFVKTDMNGDSCNFTANGSCSGIGAGGVSVFARKLSGDIGGGRMSSATSVEQLFNESGDAVGFIFLGSTTQFNWANITEGKAKVWLVKTDVHGNTCDYSGDANCFGRGFNNELIFARTYSNPVYASEDASYGKATAKQTSDGGFIFTAMKNGDIWLAKTDSRGRINITSDSVSGDLCGGSIKSNLTLTGNLTCDTNRGLVIGAPNVLIDCNGYAILSNSTIGGDTIGIYSSSGSGITIRNCTVKNFNRAIALERGSNQFVYNNILLNNGEGIDLYNAANSRIIGNRIIQDSFSFGALGVWIAGGNHNVVSNNLITRCGTGISLSGTTWNIVTQNNLTSGSEGISLSTAHFNNISYCEISNNAYDGIGISDSNANNIYSNYLGDNEGSGIYFQDWGNGSMSNKISDNTFTRNMPYGIHIYSSTSGGNIIWNNYFRQSGSANAYEQVATITANSWNSTVGNKWDNYVPPGVYPIPGPGQGIDYLPSQI